MESVLGNSTANPDSRHRCMFTSGVQAQLPSYKLLQGRLDSTNTGGEIMAAPSSTKSVKKLRDENRTRVENTTTWQPMKKCVTPDTCILKIAFKLSQLVTCDADGS